MNASVMPTEILKLVMSPFILFAVDEFQVSGWSTRRMPMFAPRRVPPCFTASVAILNTRIKLTGPEATPPVELTGAPFCRRRENEKPCRRRICG